MVFTFKLVSLWWNWFIDLCDSNVYFCNTCLEYSFDNLSNKLVMYYIFFSKLKELLFTFIIICVGGFWKRCWCGFRSADWVRCLWSNISYKTIYSVLWPINQFLHLIFYWWIYIKTKNERNRNETETKCIIGSTMLPRFFNICL